uniref:ferroxidase n=1 Tax=Knipowitschia caucasica TaxID=637954 RepID=A0AAV2K284_KNICA
MRLCRQVRLLVLVITFVFCVKAEQHRSKERHYYIAAVEIDWNYSGTKGLGLTYKKVVFREYDEGFRRAKDHPSWLGLLGPTLRAQEGETLVVTFKNMASGEYSIHPHGIAYGKQSEGAYYFDNTSPKEKVDDKIKAEGQHVYQWEVTPEVSPQSSDPSCLTYSYISHRHVVEDYNSGLIGALLICKPGTLDASGQQIGVHHELIFLFGVFNEKESKYMPRRNYESDDHIKYTINGYTHGTLPDVSMCAHTAVSLHLLGMSSDPEVFSVHMNGQVLQQDGHKVSSVGLISGSSATAHLVTVHPGRWLLSSHTAKHMEAGMHGFIHVKECKDFAAPQRTMTIAQRRQSKEWTYYIAAEEVLWDYALNMPDYTDESFKLQYLTNSAVRIGQKYKKAVYTLYKNASFTEKLETKQRRNELGILGPVIRAQIRDVIKIVFKNMASRPYSIYPHGLTIEKSQEGVNYPAGGNQSHGVAPGHTHTYSWRVVEQDEPLDADARCLTRMYHSAVDAPRDIASGLIGPMLICKSQSLNVRNVQLKADKEQHAVFAVFDENKSWYLDDNINNNCDKSRVNKVDPDFYKSNVMHTINGYMFESGPVLGFCNGEVATWHVSSVGAQDFIQTATFYGHPFELNERTEDLLSLYPMTGESITMNMDNKGVWLLASLNTHESTKGVRVKFQDVECFRDYQYEYEDGEEKTEFNVWTPVTIEEIQKEEEKEKEKEKEKEQKKPVVVDYDTDKFAAEWGLRPLPAKAMSVEEDLINNAIVIGVPRPDFSDYELYVPGNEPDHLDFNELQRVREEEYEYVSYKDPYSSDEKMEDFNLDSTRNYNLKNVGENTKIYFIAAEEVEWDYAGYGHRRQERSQLNNRETKFKKVIFREYMDSTFKTPDIRGELDEHLGILGPLIKVEVGQDIMVVFKNNASRPYSLHPNGVAYTKKTEGLNYEDGSNYWHKYDNEVHPGKTFTYLWTVTSSVGPAEGESDCRTWAYYSGVNPERDIHSGLIGPLLVCRVGTLNKTITNTREFALLFMTFDESQSWFVEENLENIQKKTRRRSLIPAMKETLLFHTINGIIHSLKGLRMYTNQLVRWHLINMGSPKDFQSVHFHGQTFFHKKIKSFKQAIYPLLPGSFATLEMIPSKPGLWQLETEVGNIQQKGMQTLFLVVDDDCYHAFGLESGSVTDMQLTAKSSRGYWEPHLARLKNAGKYNAWSTDEDNSWLQVDLQRPVVISQIVTQGAKQMFYSQYVRKFAISYSNDRRKWTFYKGDSKSFRKIFPGNQEAYETKTNTFFPPIIGRFIRLHPVDWYGKATLRLEYYGCALDGCSVPLGMESRLIHDHQISASSTASSWFGGPWKPAFARLNKQGTINAWQARSNDLQQWLQVELPQMKKITGIITQGAKSLGKELYVISFSLQYSNDGLHWTDYTDDETITSKTYIANTNNCDHVRNYIHPPIFSRFIRVIPRSWKNAITMRMELLGCDIE